MFWDRKPQPISPSEAGYRPDGSASFLQWWYFDAGFESGHHMMTIMQPHMLGRIEQDGNGRDPGITLAITSPDRTNYSNREYFPGTFQADPAGMGVSFGANRIEFRDGRYHLHLSLEDVGCHLEYEPLLPPWAPLPGRMGFMCRPMLCLSQWKPDPRQMFHYASMMPRGKVTGTLRSPLGKVSVRGEGYHEQGRTNLPLQSVFSYWYWTRLFVGDWTFIFPVAMSTRKTLNVRLRSLAIYRKQHMLVNLFDLTGLVLNHRVKEYFPCEGGEQLRVPKRTVFTARRPGLKLQVDMECVHERERFRFSLFEGDSPSQPHWLQHLTKASVRLCLEGDEHLFAGCGVFETMVTGAP